MYVCVGGLGFGDVVSGGERVYLYQKLGFLGWKILKGTGQFDVGISN